MFSNIPVDMYMHFTLQSCLILIIICIWLVVNKHLTSLLMLIVCHLWFTVTIVEHFGRCVLLLSLWEWDEKRSGALSWSHKVSVTGLDGCGSGSKLVVHYSQGWLLDFTAHRTTSCSQWLRPVLAWQLHQCCVSKRVNVKQKYKVLRYW